MKKAILLCILIISTATSLLGQNLGVSQATWLPGSSSGAPTQTCSATSYNGTFSVSSTLVLYECSNVTGTYQWNIISGNGGGGGDTITSPNSTLSVGGSSSATTLDLNLAHANTWTGLQTLVGTNITGLPMSTGVVGILPTSNGGSGTSTAPTDAQILIGQSGGNYLPKTVSGSCTVSDTGVFSCSGGTFAAHQWLGNNTGTSSTGTPSLIGVSDISPNTYAVDTGVVNAAVVNLNPPATALVAGLTFSFLPIAANTISNPTVNLNGLGVVTITHPGGNPLNAGDMQSNVELTVKYSSVTSTFEIQNQGECGVGDIPCTNTANSFTAGTQTFISGTPSTVATVVRGSGSGFGTIAVIQSTPSFNTTQALTSNVTAGDSILVLVTGVSGNVPGVPTDTLGNTYVLIGQQTSTPIDYVSAAYLAYSPSGGADTVNLNSSCCAVGGYAIELSNILPIGAGDGVVIVGASSTPTSITSGTINTTQAGDIIFSISQICCSGNVFGLTVSGYTNLPTSTTNMGGSVYYAQQSSIGAFNSTWTNTSGGSASAYLIFSVALKSAATTQQTADLVDYELYDSSIQGGVNRVGQQFLAVTAGCPTNTPSVGTLAYDSTAQDICKYTTSGWVHEAGSPSFSTITSGTNLSAAMVVGSGSSIVTSGSGTINATAENGVSCTGTPTTGQVCVATGSTTATWQTSGGVSSTTNSDGTLTISPTSGAVVASLNLSHANTWTGLQTLVGTNITGLPLTSGVTGLLPHANIATTGVTAGSYTNSNITVAADGSITSASNGSGAALPNTTTQQSNVGYTGPGTTGLATLYNSGIYLDTTTESVNSENTMTGVYGILSAGDSICNGHGLTGYANGGSGVTASWENTVANDVSAGNFYNLCVDNSISADFSTQMAAYTYPGVLCGTSTNSQAACTSTSVYAVPEIGNPINVAQVGGSDQKSGNFTSPYLQSYYLHLASGVAYRSVSDFNKYVASNSTWWTSSGFTATQNLISGTQNGLANIGTGYTTGGVETVTLNCTGGTGPTYTINTLSGGTGIGTSTLTSLGSGCTGDVYPYVVHSTTASGGGSGATYYMFISPLNTEVSTASGSTLINAQSIDVPVSGIAYLWYLKWLSSTGTATISSSVAGTGTYGLPANTALLDTLNGSTSTLSAQDTGNVSGNNPSTSLIPSVALARFIGLTPGRQIFTITTTASGNFGVLALGFPATPHSRGYSGPNFAINGLVPELGNANSANIAAYNSQAFAVAQLLKNDGLFVTFNSNSNLDYNNDFLPAQVGNITNCSANGSVATLTYTGQFATAAYQSGWTGTLASLTGNCAPLNGTVTILTTGITTTQFQIAYAGTIVSSSTTGTFTPTTGSNYNGNIANTVPPYHLSSQGNYHVAQNVEAGLKLSGLGSGTISFGGINAVGTPTAGQLGFGLNASIQSNPPTTGTFGNGIYSFCNSTGICAGQTYQTVSGLVDVGGVAGTYTALNFAPSTVPSSVNTSWSIGHYTDPGGTGATAALTPSNMTLGWVYKAGNTFHEPSSATTTTNGNSYADNYCADQTNGATATSKCVAISMGNNGNSTTSNPGLYFTPTGQTITGDFLYYFRSPSNGGIILDSGAQSGTNTATIKVPTLTGNLTASFPTSGNFTFGSGISIPQGTATFATGSGVTSVVCATGYSCNNTRGTLTLVGGTATTGVIATVNFSASLSAAPQCFLPFTPSATTYSLTNGIPTSSAFTISAGLTVVGNTLTISYICLP